VLIKQNSLSECFSGGCLVLENSSCVLINNEIKQNLQDGILITNNSSALARLVLQENPSMGVYFGQGKYDFAHYYQKYPWDLSFVLIRNCQSQENKGAGIQIKDFEGIVDIEESSFNFNETHGMLLSQCFSGSLQLSEDQSLSHMVKAKFVQHRRAQVFVHASECWGNKFQGVRAKAMKAHFLNCRIKHNNSGAITFETKQSELMLKLYCDSLKTHEIKGKMNGEDGLIYPRILVQDNIEDILTNLRNQYKHYVVGKNLLIQ